MSPKNSSLAFDETLTEIDGNHINIEFEPDLKVIINAHYLQSSLKMASNDAIEIKGRITVSF